METELTDRAILTQKPLAAKAGVAWRGGSLALGLCALLAAVPIALVILAINSALRDNPERAVMAVGVFAAAVIAAPPALYLLARRRAADARKLGLIVLATVSVVLVAIYLFQVSFQVRFPADVLIWSESDFVNDILKLRAGYPLYTAEVNNDSFVYPPGTQILTYLLASLSGQPTSIPMYRAIQLGYTLLAVVIAFLCCRKILALRSGDRPIEYSPLWGVIWLPLLFLIATNSLTNPFVQYLHDDATALLITLLAYFLLLHYIERRQLGTLALMALLPAVGFWFKQSLTIWIAFYCIHLALFDRPRSWRRVLLFALTSIAAAFLSVRLGYVLWGEHFGYWIFTVLGSHGVSPLRSFQHLLDVWPYVAIGLFGGYVLLRGKALPRLLSPWLIGLALILLQIYTSGIAWMINHIGPGSLIAGVWFLAALARLWPLRARLAPAGAWPVAWLRTGMVVGVTGLLLSGLGVVRIPLQPIPDDAYRYLRDIEQEFEGYPADRVLLDAGTWVYLDDQVVMKDRAPSIGERGYSQTGDFSGILQRIEQRYYAKILVRNLHTPDFWYDYFLWEQPSGIRQALLDHYDEVGQIAPVDDPWYLFGEVSILTPKSR
jgi:hypothetical protein